MLKNKLYTAAYRLLGIQRLVAHNTNGCSKVETIKRGKKQIKILHMMGDQFGIFYKNGDELIQLDNVINPGIYQFTFCNENMKEQIKGRSIYKPLFVVEVDQGKIRFKEGSMQATRKARKDLQKRIKKLQTELRFICHGNDLFARSA